MGKLPTPTGAGFQPSTESHVMLQTELPTSHRLSKVLLWKLGCVSKFIQHLPWTCFIFILSMVVSGSPNRWDRWHSSSPNWQYIPLIYHLYIAFLGGHMLPTTFYGNQKQPLILCHFMDFRWLWKNISNKNLGFLVAWRRQTRTNSIISIVKPSSLSSPNRSVASFLTSKVIGFRGWNPKDSVWEDWGTLRED